ncbi:MAG: hypothetical protein IPO71_13230 [Nitrosomonas sp.]|nr:hypothetical protein [Nitrosomonas sp.]
MNQWSVHGRSILGVVMSALGKKDADNKTTTCQVRDGLLVPLYFIILALMGGSISLTRRLPELAKASRHRAYYNRAAPNLRNMNSVGI